MFPHAPERRAIVGAGTDEAAWLASAVLGAMPAEHVAEWAARHDRIWLLAPHPDDEILALGGSLVCLAEEGADVRIVSITDGEASHEGSTTWSRERLAKARPIELARALERLGAKATVCRLGLPDGRVGAHRETLLTTLAEMIGENDLLLTSCRFDGHPDHETCGDIAAMVGEMTGATVFEYPVWMWHWASPDEVTIPWVRARRLPIPDGVVARKRAAIGEFVSQITPDGDRPAVLPPHVLPRFLRSFEVVFA